MRNLSFPWRLTSHDLAVSRPIPGPCNAGLQPGIWPAAAARENMPSPPKSLSYRARRGTCFSPLPRQEHP